MNEQRLTFKQSIDGFVDVGLCEGVTIGDAICKLADLEERMTVPARPTPQEWISVSERLPDTETARWQDEDGSDCAYEVSSWLWGIDRKGMQARVRYECGPVFEGWYDDAGTTYAITHWMPLPDPPNLGR